MAFQAAVTGCGVLQSTVGAQQRRSREVFTERVTLEVGLEGYIGVCQVEK